jgi:predicted metal-binding protein
MENLKNRSTKSIERGEVFYLEKISIAVVIVSNKMHNLLSNYLIAALVTDRKTDEIRETLETNFEFKKKKLKIMLDHFYTLKKKTLQETGIL